MKIAIRMDDITPDMDWKRFEEFKALLDRYQVKPLIGIVPNNQDEHLNQNEEDYEPPEFWQYMRELKEQGWVVAMHGYRHMYTTKKGGMFPLNQFSEFAGLDYETQCAMLADGKRILEEKGIGTDIFMAPAHSYDKNTLKALKDIGFTKITDGFGRRPYIWRSITFYPISFQLSRSLKKTKGTTTMVIHANEMSEKDMERCVGYLEKKGVTLWISYQEYLEQTPCVCHIWQRISEYCLAGLKSLLVRLRG